MYDSDADYLLFYSEKKLYELFLQRGILIRDCSNFRGLQRGYYRIAVKSEEQALTENLTAIWKKLL